MIRLFSRRSRNKKERNNAASKVRELERQVASLKKENHDLASRAGSGKGQKAAIAVPSPYEDGPSASEGEGVPEGRETKRKVSHREKKESRRASKRESKREKALEKALKKQHKKEVKAGVAGEVHVVAPPERRDRLQLYRQQMALLDLDTVTQVKAALKAFMNVQDIDLLAKTMNGILHDPVTRPFHNTVVSIIPAELRDRYCKHADDFKTFQPQQRNEQADVDPHDLAEYGDGLTEEPSHKVHYLTHDEAHASGDGHEARFDALVNMAETHMAKYGVVSRAGSRHKLPSRPGSRRASQDHKAALAAASGDGSQPGTSGATLVVPPVKITVEEEEEEDDKGGVAASSQRISGWSYQKFAEGERPVTEEEDTVPPEDRKRPSFMHCKHFRFAYTQATSREQVEQELEWDAKEPGTFAVRHKKLPPDARADNAWVLSLVELDGQIKHYLVEDPGQGAPLVMSGSPVGNSVTLGALLDFLKDSSNYQLKRLAFSSQPWYHGPISRQEAEGRLDHMPFDGAFLVRKSTRHDHTVVISLMAKGTVHHTEVEFDRRKKLWAIAGQTELKFKSLYTLIEHYEQPGCGFHGVDLSAPCPRHEDDH